MLPTILDIATLRAAFAAGRLDPVGLAEIVAERMAASPDPAIFITAVPRADPMAGAHTLMAAHPEPNFLPL